MERKAVIFDFNRTLYDPKNGMLYPEAAELLAELSAERRLFLYSKLEGGRADLLSDLGIADHFEDTYFVEHKTPDSILAIIDTHGLSSEEVIIVGDLLSSELAAGREAGLETVWVRQGRFADELAAFEPDHTVRSIPELRVLFQQLA